MKTLKKIFIILLLIVIWYIALIFYKPYLADSIWKPLWLSNFNLTVNYIKHKFDGTSTGVTSTIFIQSGSTNPQPIPAWIQAVDTAFSWVTEVKNTVLGWLDSTKERIDNIRETVNWVENQYNDAKIKVEETKKIVNDVSKIANGVSNLANSTWSKVDDTKKIVEDSSKVAGSVSNLVSGTWSKNK